MRFCLYAQMLSRSQDRSACWMLVAPWHPGSNEFAELQHLDVQRTLINPGGTQHGSSVSYAVLVWRDHSTVLSRPTSSDTGTTSGNKDMIRVMSA
jgi:hypothetical protein